MNQIKLENMAKELILALIFGQTCSPPLNLFMWVLLLLDVRHCRKLSLYAISRKMHDPNWRKWKKNSFGTWFRPTGLKVKPKNYFSKTWLHQSVDIKLTIQSWENLVIDGRRCRQMDKSDFIRCCLTNVEHPKYVFSFTLNNLF